MKHAIQITRCPNCGGVDTVCFDSRLRAIGRYRRRKCFGCKHRWSTIEMAAEKIGNINVPKNIVGLLNEIAAISDALHVIDERLETIKRPLSEMVAGKKIGLAA